MPSSGEGESEGTTQGSLPCVPAPSSSRPSDGISTFPAYAGGLLGLRRAVPSAPLDESELLDCRGQSKVLDQQCQDMTNDGPLAPNRTWQACRISDIVALQTESADHRHCLRFE